MTTIIRRRQRPTRRRPSYTEWGTVDYYIHRLSTPTPPLHVDVCDARLTDDDAYRLADALSSRGGYGGSTLRKLRLRGSQITSRGFLAMAEAIGGVAGSTSVLREIDLGHSPEIADDADDFAFGMYLLLSAAGGLRHLNLEGCFLDRAACAALVDCLAACAGGRSLESLNLADNSIDDDAVERLASGVRKCPNLAQLDLGRNYIEQKGAAVLAAECVTSNGVPSLRHLILRGNRVGDVGARNFARALRSNSILRELNLSENGVSSTGLEALLYAIFDVSSLNALRESNHSLCYVLERQSVEDLLRRGCDHQLLFDILNVLQLNDIDGQLNRFSGEQLPAWASDLPLTRMSVEHLKVVVYLTKCFDMRHFLGMDRAMIPQALEFVAANFGCGKVFHLVGQWNMPELFLHSPRTIEATQDGQERYHSPVQGLD